VLVAAFALLAAYGSHPAYAIIFQTTADQTAGLGAGQDFLNPEAKLTIGLSDGSQSGCSGSLLAGGQYVLTAAHCVTGGSDTLTARSISVNFANTGLTVTTNSYVVDPTWNGSLTNGGDLALIKLSTPVTTIAGYVLDTASSAVGQVVTITGYGNTGVGGNGYTSGTFGTLYYGTNTYLGVFSNVPSVYGFLYTQTFGVGAPDVMIAPGDSGGGSLIDVAGVWEIVGVHDFVACTTNGCVANGSYGQYGGDTSIYADQAWIDSVVPEPAPILVVALGVLGLAGVRRRSLRL
jgi:hypothetical protein